MKDYLRWNPFASERGKQFEHDEWAWDHSSNRDSLPIPILHLTVEEARDDYPAIWRVIARDLPQLNEVERAIVVSIALGICPHCHKRPHGCQCWNDE